MGDQELSKNGQFSHTLKNGEVVKYSKDLPLWLVLSEKCSTENDLKELAFKEAERCPQLRGVKFWENKKLGFKYLEAVKKVFSDLASAERDKGLNDIYFVKQVYEAIRSDKDLYWFSPAHVNLAIRRGMQGSYNKNAQLYGNKITVRHIVSWLREFAEVWMSGSDSSYDTQKFDHMDNSSERTGEKTLGQVVGNITKPENYKAPKKVEPSLSRKLDHLGKST